jgi:hypothetical protein
MFSLIFVGMTAAFFRNIAKPLAMSTLALRSTCYHEDGL